MKKRIVSTLLALCMLLCLMPTAAFAEESAETPPVCSCETACTADNMNKECPVCGAEGALPDNCAKYAQPADDAAVQPVGEVSDPQPETALTALSGEGVTPAAGETVRDVRTADELTAAIADSSVNTVKLAGDISISSFLTVTRTVTLDLNGHVLQMTGNDSDPVIEVKKDSNGVGIGNLTLTDSASNTAHKFTPNADGLWVLDEENGTKTVNGGVITGSKKMGIWVDGDYGSHLTQKPAEDDCVHLIMEGGNIVGCAAMAGGGVYASFYAYFTMSGGSIRGCVAKAGGGVCLANSASFAMGGSALIADCISTDGGSCGGGGIGADLGALVALSGNAVIQNCTAQLGGGVYLNDATLTMSGNASVTGCNSIAGGGVYVRGNVTENDPPVFTMEDSSSITDCTALNGGGIFVATHSGKVSLSDSAKIKNCRAVEKVKLDFPNVTGGGVHVSSGSFEMSGGSIESCTAVNGGNSVFVCTGGYGKFTMTGGTVDGSITMPYTVGNEPVYMDGLGTAVSPYQISTADQLKLFRDIVNGSNGQTPNRGACAVLMNDIVLNDGTFDEDGNYTTGASGKAVETWTPIAYSGPFTVDTTLYYTGTFDGQGHAIKGMYVSINDAPSIEDQVCLGLFSTAKNAVIRNVTVTGYVSGYAGNLGGIVGYLAGGTIENCANYCTVTDTLAAPEVTSYVGGIAGAVNCSAAIRDCYNTGKLTEYVFVKYHKTGGIVGYIGSSAVSNCYNVGKVAGKGWYNGEIIGFIAGEDAEETPSTINNCYYLNTTNKAVGNDADTVTNTGPKTAVQFGNGTVLALLINGRADSAHPWNSQCKYLAAAGSTLPVFKTQTGDAHRHDWGAWASNGDGTHSRRCTCNAAETVNCSGGTATCTQRAKCTDCKAEYGDALGHDFTVRQYDNDNHWMKCSRCDEIENKSPHTWDNGTVTTAPTCTKEGETTYICTECGATKTEPINATGHSWKSDWTSDATHHWHECTNENCDVTDNSGKNGYAEHTDGKATCTEKAKCTVCGVKYGAIDPANHTGTEQWTQTTATHEKKWSCCGVITVQSENHKWTDGVCSECGYVCQHKDTDKNHICDICGKTISEHKDADNNHICDYCNKKISDHIGGTATCKDKAICEICKESYGSLDPNNHTDLKHIDAKAATAAEEGNIEYWYCDDCNKYFSDAAAKTEITKAATVTAKLPPQITAGDGAAVTQGEKNELTFTSNASFADFLRVELDGATLEEKNYTKREGSTIITLNRDFVASLSVGEHTLAIVSQHGTATAKFTVKAKPAETATPQPTETTTPQPTAQPQQTAQPQATVQPTVQPVSPIPRTGDTANPALWFALLIVSGSALAAIFVLRRKANRK
ncbi:pectate lyase-like adhesive domain-containing protein [Gemmiger sp.]